MFERSDLPEEYAAGNYESDETVHAGYVMYNRAFNEQLSGSFGVRVEATSATFTGNEFNDDTESVTPVKGENSYTDLLPSALFRYELDANTIFRAAWTNTLVRPGFYELVPYREIAVEDNELAVGNPDLEPTRSMNFDVMLEKYYGSVGLISGGVFYKDIQDFIYVLEDKDAVDPATGRTYDSIFRPVNGATASLVGFEVAVQRQVEQLPGLGVLRTTPSRAPPRRTRLCPTRRLTCPARPNMHSIRAYHTIKATLTCGPHLITTVPTSIRMPWT